MLRTPEEIEQFSQMGVEFGEIVEPAKMASAPPQGPQPPPSPSPGPPGPGSPPPPSPGEVPQGWHRRVA